MVSGRIAKFGDDFLKGIFTILFINIFNKLAPRHLLKCPRGNGGAAGAAHVAGAAVSGLGLAEIAEKVAGTAL